MKLKLDENVLLSAVQILVASGHDVHTVPQEELSGAVDGDVLSAAREEGRCLVTFDLDFANPVHYPPEEFEGIVVLRVPSTRIQLMERLISELARWLENRDPAGQLWIVEPGRLRVHDRGRD